MPSLQLPADFSHRKPAGRTDYLLATLVAAGDRSMVRLVPKQGAAMLSALAMAEAFAVLAPDMTEIEPGDPVAVLPLDSLVAH